MAKITKITPQIKNPERLNVFVDGEFFIGLEEFYIADLGLKTGKEMTNELAEKLLNTSRISDCMKKAFNLLAYRNRTSFELSKRLKEVGFSSDEIDFTIKKLDSIGYLNDEKFLKDYIGSAVRKGHSERKIAFSLSTLGVPKEEYTHFIDKICTEDSQAEAVERLIEKKIKELSKLDKYKKKQRLVAYLSGKGFDFEIIFSQIDKFILQDD